MDDELFGQSGVDELHEKIWKIFLFLILVGLEGFGQKYTIRGTLPDHSFDNQYIILSKARLPLEKEEIIDSVKVKNGRFVFKGKTREEPFLARLNFSDNRRVPDFLIIEPGKINVTVSRSLFYSGQSDSSAYRYYSNVSGTPLNDEYNKEMIIPFQAVMSANTLGPKRDKVFREGRFWTEADELAYREALPEKLIASHLESKWNYLESHIQYPGVIAFFLASDSPLTNERKQRILAKLPEQTVNRIRQHQDSLKKLTEQYLREGWKPKMRIIENPPEAVRVGKPFLDFTGETLDGKQISLSEVVKSNKLVLLDFWASWCGPCMKEMPNIAEIYKQYKSKGLEIIGISSDADPRRWTATIEKNHMNWLQIRSSGEDRIGQMYGIIFIPATVLIDHKGNIVARKLRDIELKEKIKELLGE